MNRLTKESHAIEEIGGIRCAVVEKNVSKERTEFLKSLLEHNGYTVMVAPSPPPKVVAKPAAPASPVSPASPPAASSSLPSATAAAPSSPPSAAAAPSSPPPAPETFTVGVTDFLFHTQLAIYERALKTPEGKIVSIDYWNQQPEKEGEYYWKRGFFTNSL